RYFVQRESRDVPQVDGEQRRRQVAHQPLAEAQRGARRRPEMYVDVGVEERSEEPEPLDVVHVQVGEQQVDAPERRRERAAEEPDPGPRVQDRDAVVLGPYLHAGGVAAVARGVRSRGGERAAHAPEPDPHGGSVSQKTATAPTERPPGPISGSAVPSIR